MRYQNTGHEIEDCQCFGDEFTSFLATLGSFPGGLLFVDLLGCVPARSLEAGEAHRRGLPASAARDADGDDD
jgi:hypothetical protein